MLSKVTVNPDTLREEVHIILENDSDLAWFINAVKRDFPENEARVIFENCIWNLGKKEVNH